MKPEEPANDATARDSRRTVRTFALASFLNDFGSDMIYPLWPLFVTTVLGANMAILGLLDGIGDAMVAVSQAASGYAADRLQRRKPFIWIGYLFGSASRVGYALSLTWQHVLPFRILDRSGKIRSAPRDAMVAEASTNENRGRNFGLVRSMDHLGAVCGIVTSIVLFDLGYRTLFLIAAVPSLIAVALILITIRDPVRSTGKLFKGLRLADLDRNFWLFLIQSAVFAVASFSYSFLLLSAEEYGISAGKIPVLYLVFTLAAALFALPLGKLADRFGRKSLLFFSYILWALVCAGFLVVDSPWGIVALFVLYGLHKAAIEPAQKTLVAELAPAPFRASTIGGFQMVIGIATLPSSIVAGVLWESVGFRAPFVVALGLTVASSILLLFVRERVQATPGGSRTNS